MIWNAILGSFLATVMLTGLLSAGRGLGLTRMDLPFLLGTMFTPDRDRAKWVGFLFHLCNGWVFGLIYVAIFLQLGNASWWLGALIGLAHALFVLASGMMLLPSIHPRMANEQQGPDPTRMLEPPGFMALHYGYQTPLATIIAHLVYGAVLAGFVGRLIL